MPVLIGLLFFHGGRSNFVSAFVSGEKVYLCLKWSSCRWINVCSRRFIDTDGFKPDPCVCGGKKRIECFRELVLLSAVVAMHRGLNKKYNYSEVYWHQSVKPDRFVCGIVKFKNSRKCLLYELGYHLRSVVCFEHDFHCSMPIRWGFCRPAGCWHRWLQTGPMCLRYCRKQKEDRVLRTGVCCD